MATIIIEISEDDAACLWANNWRDGTIEEIASAALQKEAAAYRASFPASNFEQITKDFQAEKLIN